MTFYELQCEVERLYSQGRHLEWVSLVAADLAVCVLDAKRQHRAGEWEPGQRGDVAGWWFCVLTAPLAGILWAWEPQVRAWAARRGCE